jgi:hypothetical protein
MSYAAAHHSSLTLVWIAHSEPPALTECCDDRRDLAVLPAISWQIELHHKNPGQPMWWLIHADILERLTASWSRAQRG